ncbi:hypothetical protein [Streptobacillus moniliformis]|uniref:Uncharacterized protein n=1 Tax=Streptobacillus moniliformis (strain ATCC 14647 / DSM 12112 / NCTC 10651 / 9901) TaxID=519441 RepID=D1AW53_STRM9|nr:hypothetical protein [Streptobacillus moniliformis]ACZ00529.1 hypothetical protein Smon_0031 [Streptobacillus moniliformis DSM 12112]SQA12825.1 Uncharacterised protein [Streptobacillus moniliformis]
MKSDYIVIENSKNKYKVIKSIEKVYNMTFSNENTFEYNYND